MFIMIIVLIKNVYLIYSIGVPFPPQGLMSRVLEYGSEYFTIEVTWEPAYQDIDSRVDFYHYQVIDGLLEENASVVLDLNTTNTTIIIDINKINISAALLQFVLSACNCNGASIPVAVVIFNGENYGELAKYHMIIFIFNYCYAYTESESDHFGGKTTHTISSRPSLGSVTEIQEFQNNTNVSGLTSIYSACAAGVFIMLITCMFGLISGFSKVTKKEGSRV